MTSILQSGTLHCHLQCFRPVKFLHNLSTSTSLGLDGSEIGQYHTAHADRPVAALRYQLGFYSTQR